MTERGPARSPARGLARWLIVPVVMTVGAACSAEPEPTPAPAAAEQPPPFADCAALTAPPAAALTARPGTAPVSPAAARPSAAASPAAAPSAGARGASSAGTAVAADLPELELPCFTGGEPVRLTSIRGPAVINLWGSWCEPCREELPVMQRLADRTTGRLTVLTVNTYDRREAAASFAAAKGVSLPTLFDSERKLASALGRLALPVTVFVDGSGRAHVDPKQFDEARLAEAVAERTGVTVGR